MTHSIHSKRVRLEPPIQMFDYNGSFFVATASHQQVVAVNVLNFFNPIFVDSPDSLDQNMSLFSFELLKPQRLAAIEVVGKLQSSHPPEVNAQSVALFRSKQLGLRLTELQARHFSVVVAHEQLIRA